LNISISKKLKRNTWYCLGNGSSNSISVGSNFKQYQKYFVFLLNGEKLKFKWENKNKNLAKYLY